MEAILKKLTTKEVIRTSLFDVFAISVVYLVPVFSHLFAIPLYYAEPMRLMLVLAIMFTSKKNALFIAVTMPFFSMLISGHPIFYKALLISAELFVNVIFYFIIIDKVKNKFAAMAVSILSAKFFYYFIKILLVNIALLSGEIIATPIIIQLGVVLVYSAIFTLKKS